MSNVTAVYFQFSVAEYHRGEQGEDSPLFTRIQEGIKALGFHGLNPLTDSFAGGKHPQIYAFGGAFNGIDEQALTALFGVYEELNEPSHYIALITPEQEPVIVIKGIG